jgi:hypothetical protein
LVKEGRVAQDRGRKGGNKKEGVKIWPKKFTYSYYVFNFAVLDGVSFWKNCTER